MNVESITLKGVEYDFGLYTEGHSRTGIFDAVLSGGYRVRLYVFEGNGAAVFAHLPYEEAPLRNALDRKHALAAGLVVEEVPAAGAPPEPDGGPYAPAGRLAEEWAKVLASPVVRDLTAVA